MKRLAKKVLVIGWDAADWKVINPLIENGQMPALERLINNGVMGNISTLDPPFSPILWTSIATGKYADKHGVLGFTEPDPDGMGMRPVTSLSRKTKAIWNILSQNNLKTHVVGWWPSNPVEPIHGIMISNHYQQANKSVKKPWPIVPGTVHPHELSEFFAELRVHPLELTDEILLPFVPDAAKIDQRKDKRLYQIAKNIAEAASVQAASTWIMDTQPWDFMAVYFSTIDHFCHGFMQYHPPKMSFVKDEDFQMFNNVVTAAYRFQDMMLDASLKMAGDDTTVIIVSDHGFHSDHLRNSFISDEPAGPAEQHRNHGIVCISGAGIKKDELIYGTSLLNITPTILTLFGLPVGKDMDGIPIMQAFKNQPIIETIPSWDNVKGDSGMISGKFKVSPLETRKSLQQLIDLGYIEDPGPDKTKAAEKAEVETMYNLARVLAGTNKFNKAIDLFSQLYEKYPDESRFAVRLVRCYMEIGEYNKADKLLEQYLLYISKIIKKQEDIEEEYNKKETSSVKEKKKLQAQKQKDIRHNLTMLASIAQAQFIKIDLLILNNKTQEALHLTENIAKSGNKSLSILNKLAKIFYKLNDFDKSIEFYSKILEIDPHNWNVFNGLTLNYLAQKNYIRAANAALDTIGLNYYHPFAHSYLGDALYELSDYENAAKAYEVSLKILPSMGTVRNKLIELYSHKLNKPELAKIHKEFFNKKNLKAAEADQYDANDLSELQSKFIEFTNPIIIVSGLPRSGTSMIMQMLEAGGIDPFTDNLRNADESNPKGYYEHEAVKRLARDKKWLSNVNGRVVKVISHLLKYLPAKYNYKIIFILRDINEVVQSQHKMLLRSGKHKSDTYPVGIQIAMKNQLMQADEWLKVNHNAAVLYLQHKDVLENPVDTADRIQKFLGKELNIKKMAAIVDKNLYREKKPA